MLKHHGNSKDSQEQQDHKGLGLSRSIYGLGQSARDGIITVVAGTAALFPVFFFGQGKVGVIDKIAQWPEKIKNSWHGVLGKEAGGKAGRALAVSSGIAFLLSHVTNLPGFVVGFKKVKAADEQYEGQIQQNRELAHENDLLSNELKNKTLELAELQRQTATADAPDAPTFASRLENKQPMATKAEMIGAQKAAQLDSSNYPSH